MMFSNPIAIHSVARTPFAKAFTALRDVSAVELGRHVVVESLCRSSLVQEQIDEVIFGNVAGPPDAANIARVIALRAGFPTHTLAHTVNRNCGSAMESIVQACHLIESGRAQHVVAGGTESMSRIPLLVSDSAAKRWWQLFRARTWMDRIKVASGFRPRHFKPIAGIELGLTDPVCEMNMGQTAEVLAEEFSIRRDDQDAYALESHVRASEARSSCFFSGEIAPMELADGSTMQKDNGPRENQNLDQLAKLRPLFGSGGSVTAGNSCPLTDGAAALVLGVADKRSSGASEPLGYITGYAIAGCDPKRMGLGPVYAVAKLLRQTHLRMEDFDLIELNEAFAAQVIACQRAAQSKSFAERELLLDRPLGEFDSARTNIHGGAIALGHPVGTTGARLVITLLRSLHRTGKRRGLATLCIGGGQGMAMIVETQREHEK